MEEHNFVPVETAETIIGRQSREFGTESVPFAEAAGRVLAEDIVADRDLPPFNRVTMDGVAIKYEAFERGISTFRISATQAAGDPPVNITQADECIEIMTGAALPETTDTVIPYEDMIITDHTATIRPGVSIARHQRIHFRGKDKRKSEVLVRAGSLISPAVITVATAVGKTEMLVKRQPAIIIISTGDELVDIFETPAPSQIRRSNNYMLDAVLKQHGLAPDMMHLPDDPVVMEEQLRKCLSQYEVLLLSGGVSMGKFDFLPRVLAGLQVRKLFHKVKQRPGKPFWFGVHETGVPVFAFPGNPVSSFMCLHRYFLPWLYQCYGMKLQPAYAVLDENLTFAPPLQYFLQVKLNISPRGEWRAAPVEGNGSGDFANLLHADAFMELPLGNHDFKTGEVYRVWPFQRNML